MPLRNQYSCVGVGFCLVPGLGPFHRKTAAGFYNSMNHTGIADPPSEHIGQHSQMGQQLRPRQSQNSPGGAKKQQTFDFISDPLS